MSRGEWVFTIVFAVMVTAAVCALSFGLQGLPR